MSSPVSALCDTYGYSLHLAKKNSPISPELFSVPDHVAFKAFDSASFDTFLDRMEYYADERSFVRMDGRRIAAAWFSAGISVKKCGAVHWLEVIEPRPERIGNDLAGIEHMEFFYPDLDKAAALLDQAEWSYTAQSNKSHAWLSSVFTPEGLEVKFSDRILAELVAEGIASGEATIL